MSERIVVADGDASSREFIAELLTEGGWNVIAVSDGAAALAEIHARRPHLVVLDLSLREIPGIELCRRVRRDPDIASVALVVLSARASELDRVVAFEVGVDDFIVKPCSGRELVLRVQAVLRRSRPQLAAVAQYVTIGPLVVDRARHRVTVAGRDIALTALEFNLLAFLVANPERVHSREMLLSSVWGPERNLEVRIVDSYVRRVRAKLGEAGTLIETLRGMGYRLRDATRQARSAM